MIYIILIYNHGQNATENLVIIKNNIINGLKRNSINVEGHRICNEGFKVLITNNTFTNCLNDDIIVIINGNKTKIENNNIHNNNRTGFFLKV